ncbi:hypothetical protein H6G04_27060 [Calothrix membranacea FACHB-236]|nr:hypothetical protein [Calothrix membranacea FACHB-236]
MSKNQVDNPYSNAILEVSPKTGSLSLTPEQQNKIIDTVILQSGGIGLGIILSIIGILLIFKWLGVRDALIEWAKKQSVQSEMLKSAGDSLESISENLTMLTRQSNEHNDRMREANLNTNQKLTELDFKVTNVQRGVDEIQSDIKDYMKQNPRNR